MSTPTIRGFTLIELLVVIAIIGTLAAVVLASLSTTRIKAVDASIKHHLSDMRTAAELMYSNTGTYDTVCDPSSNSGQLFFSALTLSNVVNGAADCIPSGTPYYDYTYPFGANPSVIPKSNTSGKWRAAVKLRNGHYFCVDYTGNATTTDSLSSSITNPSC
jgi:prepilin-type N-terminal cleavage/methylation domain-containing protein